MQASTFCIFLQEKEMKPCHTYPDLSLTCLTRPSCCVRCVDTASSSFTGAMTWPTKPRSDLVPKHFPSSPDLLNLLCIEHSNSSVTILRSAGLNFAQYIYFTFYYILSMLWTLDTPIEWNWNLSEQHQNDLHHASSSKGWCVCTCNLAVLPAQLQRETSGLSLSLVQHAHPLWKLNWHRHVKLKLVYFVHKNMFCATLSVILNFFLLCAQVQCVGPQSQTGTSLITLPAASDQPLDPHIQPKILRCREHMPQRWMGFVRVRCWHDKPRRVEGPVGRHPPRKNRAPVSNSDRICFNPWKHSA